MKEFTEQEIERIEELIDDHNAAEATQEINSLHPADIAELFQSLNLKQAEWVFNLIDDEEKQADVLMELIHYVFQEYRAERGHAGTPTMRRIEKEAYAWADQEIHTTAQAEEYLQRKQARQELAQQVLQVLEIHDRAPSRTERSYIASWLDMGFGCDAIAEAYDRTVVATGARKWAYLNRILMSWHEKGLHTPEEIETVDPRAAGKRRAANTAAPAAERDDLDRVEQLLRKMEQTNT